MSQGRDGPSPNASTSLIDWASDEWFFWQGTLKLILDVQVQQEGCDGVGEQQYEWELNKEEEATGFLVYVYSFIHVFPIFKMNF